MEDKTSHLISAALFTSTFSTLSSANKEKKLFLRIMTFNYVVWCDGRGGSICQNVMGFMMKRQNLLIIKKLNAVIKYT